jgi:hypothetical protein
MACGGWGFGDWGFGVMVEVWGLGVMACGARGCANMHE